MKIVFFDGECSLCNGLVDFLIKIDRKKILKFASLQGETAKDILGQPAGRGLDSIIYWVDGRRSEKSTAVLDLLSDLGGLWIVVKGLKIIPEGLRDVIYRFIARHRYQIFGKRPICRVPTEAEKEYLLP